MARIFLAIMLLGAGVAGAVYISTLRLTHRVDVWAPCYAQGYARNGYGANCFPASQYLTTTMRPAWMIPAAILVGFAGLGACAATLWVGDARARDGTTPA